MKVSVSKSGSQTRSESFLNMRIFFNAAMPKVYKIISSHSVQRKKFILNFILFTV